jgi:hypothetical protein
MTFVTVCVPWRLKEHINPDTSVLVGKPPKPHKVLSRFIRFFGTALTRLNKKWGDLNEIVKLEKRYMDV